MKNNNFKVYFRIPFTMYFVGKIKTHNKWSKLYLFKKKFDCEGWYWEVV